MKHVAKLVSLAAVALMLGGCATPYPLGSIFTEVNMPVSATGSGGKKMGQAKCMSFVGAVAIGDCSTETAMKNGHITKVSHVDLKVRNILGAYGEYTVTVYGD